MSQAIRDTSMISGGRNHNLLDLKAMYIMA